MEPDCRLSQKCGGRFKGSGILDDLWVLGCVIGRVAPHVSKRYFVFVFKGQAVQREQHNKTGNVTLRRVLATIVVVEKRRVLHNMSACVCNLR